MVFEIFSLRVASLDERFPGQSCYGNGDAHTGEAQESVPESEVFEHKGQGERQRHGEGRRSERHDAIHQAQPQTKIIMIMMMMISTADNNIDDDDDDEKKKKKKKRKKKKKKKRMMMMIVMIRRRRMMMMMMMMMMMIAVICNRAVCHR